MTRRYTTEIINLIGPDTDIPAPDVYTNPQVMAWIMDTYSMGVGHTVRGVVTGKPLELGGSRGRNEATGRGCVVTILEAAKRIGLDISQSTVAVQGYGNVGGIAAALIVDAGAKLIAASDSKGAASIRKGQCRRKNLGARSLRVWRRPLNGDLRTSRPHGWRTTLS